MFIINATKNLLNLSSLSFKDIQQVVLQKQLDLETRREQEQRSKEIGKCNICTPDICNICTVAPTTYANDNTYHLISTNLKF